MKKLLLTTLALLVLTFASQAQGKRYVGEKWGGGVVFQASDPGQGKPALRGGGRIYTQHGLIAAETDLQGSYKWEDAIADCSKLNLGGYNDWRLPNIEELKVLYANRDIVGGFSNKYYWSSTEVPSVSTYFYRPFASVAWFFDEVGDDDDDEFVDIDDLDLPRRLTRRDANDGVNKERVHLARLRVRAVRSFETRTSKLTE